MSVTVQIVGAINGMETPFDGLYVAGEYVPERGGFGNLPATSDRGKARRFADHGEAFEWWRQEHPQGMGGVNVGGHNRPLTFFTVQIDSVS
jgi:hypothetical protein